MKQLIHNGVYVPRYEPKGLWLIFRGKALQLSPKQEEMAVAWAKVIGTECEGDEKFVKNFFKDFAVALGVDESIGPQDFDFSPILKALEGEKNDKSLKEKRKKLREAIKAKYGHVIVDGELFELSNFTAEPSGIFRGRGKHPLRGRWKEGPEEGDIELNLSPDAPMPPGNWKGRVWEPDAMWIGRWRDKLRGEMKYIWLPELAPMRQEREKDKYDLARTLGSRIERVRAHIWKNLQAQDESARKISTVAWLIDSLKLRVGDEKDIREEANTVGATTLRPQHVKLRADGWAHFSFIGKDYVRWSRKIRLPVEVARNLKEFIANSHSAIFEGIRSEDVNAFLGQAMEGLTAKVFRTYHATRVMEESLPWDLDPSAPEYEKLFAFKMANLQVAMALNHKKKPPRRWMESLSKKKARLKELENKLAERRAKAKGERALKSLRSLKLRIRKLKLQVRLAASTATFNLNTSLKNYIDPRVVHAWCSKVSLGWERIYPKSLRRKFAWVLDEENATPGSLFLAKPAK